VIRFHQTLRPTGLMSLSKRSFDLFPRETSLPQMDSIARASCEAKPSPLVGGDSVVFVNCNAKNDSCTNDTGQDKQRVFTGGHTFDVQEIEIFQTNPVGVSLRLTTICSAAKSVWVNIFPSARPQPVRPSKRGGFGKCPSERNRGYGALEWGRHRYLLVRRPSRTAGSDICDQPMVLQPI
jgi:hypothetical protein